MVDKAVDSGWKKQAPPQKFYVSKDLTRRIHARFLAALVTFFMTIFLFFCSISRATKKLPDSSSHHEHTVQELAFDSDFRPPSPAPAELLTSLLKRLCELDQEKVSTLQDKPSEMPYEKEEVLNAAVYRVDALVAELIATKKALHEALIKQEDLLAYIDSREDAKFRVSV